MTSCQKSGSVSLTDAILVFNVSLPQRWSEMWNNLGGISGSRWHRGGRSNGRGKPFRHAPTWQKPCIKVPGDYTGMRSKKRSHWRRREDLSRWLGVWRSIRSRRSHVFTGNWGWWLSAASLCKLHAYFPENTQVYSNGLEATTVHAVIFTYSHHFRPINKKRKSFG